jgi:hypothetical protein
MIGPRAVALAVAAALTFALAAEPASAEPSEPRIVGGAPVTIDQFPWQVALADSLAVAPGQNGFQRQFCGGTLVAPTIVITAAHCVYDFNPQPLTCSGVGEGFDLPASDFAVFTGRTNLSSNQGQEIDVAELYYFENVGGTPTAVAQSTGDGDGLFDCETNQWDAVFLELGAPSTTGTPIKIAGADEAALWAGGQPASISGWGDLADDAGDFPDQLHAAEVAMIDDATCGSPSSYGAGFFAETMVCAGIFPQGGIDTCQGDSGGPLVVGAFQKARAVNAVRLVGDTSFGFGCAQPNFPGVYGRLAADPLRSAMRNGILSVAGVDVVGSGAVPPDATPPVTRITKHPRKRGTKARAKFRFVADEPAAFECRLDRKPFAPCSSPFSRKVARKRHTFRVRATDEQGNIGGGDKFKWKVKRKRR